MRLNLFPYQNGFVTIPPDYWSRSRQVIETTIGLDGSSNLVFFHQASRTKVTG
jgi:hypothetical protein